MSNKLLRLKEKARNKLTNIKTNIKNDVETFQKHFDEAKKEPRSKRKSFFLGAATVFGIFGVTIFTPMLPAIAKDIPKNPVKPGDVAPIPPSTAPNMDVIKTTGTKALATFVGGICAAAFADGTFLLGGLCGFLVVSGMIANKKK